MTDKKPGLGLVSSTDHRKTKNEVATEAEKRAGECDESVECAEDEATDKIDRLRRQNSLVMRIDRRVRLLLEEALVS